MHHYRIGESSNEHVESLEFNEAGDTISAEFYFDHTIGGEVTGRYGIYGISRPLSEQLTSCGFTGFDIGEVKCSVSPHAEMPEHIELPDLVLLIASGRFMVDDVSLTNLKQLIVSERVYDLMVDRDPDIALSSREVGRDGRPVAS